MKLSILIATTPDRIETLFKVLSQIHNQIEENKLDGDVEILVEEDNYEMSIGGKRQKLLDRSKGDYIAFVDSDDRIGEDYIKEVVTGIGRGVDCCSLKGIIKTNGVDEKVFIHSIEYNSYFEKDNIYFRFPNHLNTIKSSIAKQFRFKEINHGEDTDFAIQLHKSRLLKTEHKIDSIIYYYDYISNKKK